MIKEHHVVLHGLAIKKHADASAIASVCQMPVELVGAALAALKDRQLVFESSDFYSLTPVGAVVLGNQYAQFCAGLRRTPAFVDTYDQFEVVNTDLKALITEWQVVETGGLSSPNDHSDEAYDNHIIDRLGGVHERVEIILKQLAAHEPRLSTYIGKLQAALERAEDGEIEWVSDVRIESYHTVWFELHEDLLRLLGKKREE